MNNNDMQIPEHELHAYVDGRLDAARRAEVDAWLERHPGAAERLHAYRQQNDMMQALFNPVLKEPIPLGMHPRARPRHFPMPLRYAAMISAMVISGILGWSLRGVEAPQQKPIMAMVNRAALAHVVYTPEVLHPVEVSKEQEAQLVHWLSKRLGNNIRAPHLAGAGYELMGGRLLPGNQGPVAQFMYQDGKGQRLTLYISSKMAGKGEASFRFAQEGKVGVFYWVDEDLGYALSGEIAKPDLLKVANNVYQELNK